MSNGPEQNASPDISAPRGIARTEGWIALSSSQGTLNCSPLGAGWKGRQPQDGRESQARATEKLDTEYQVKTRRQSTPLSEDPDLVEKWLKDAKDISYVEVSEDPEEDRTMAGKHALFVLPYNRISKEFLDEVAEEVDDEVEEDEPVTKKSKSAPIPVSKPKAVAKDEEDEEDEVNPKDDDEDDVEKEVSTRRAARRSFRR